MTHIKLWKICKPSKVLKLHGMMGDEAKLESQHIRFVAFGSMSVTQTLPVPFDLKLKCLIR